MNYNQRFDEHINEQFQHYTPQVHPRIWENIVKEREKRRPAGFWLRLFNRRGIMLLAGLVVLAGGGAYILLNHTTAIDKTKVTAAATKNTSGQTPNNTAATTAINQPAPNAYNDKNNPAATTAAPVNTNNSNTAGDSQKSTATDAAAGTTGTAPLALATGFSYAEKDAGNSPFAAAGGTTKFTRGASQKIKIKKGAAAFETEEEDATTSGAVPFILPSFFYTAEKNTANKATGRLGKRSTAVKEPGCPTIEQNAAGNKTYIEIYGGPDMAFRSMSDTGNSVYLQKRKESTRFSSAFSAGLRYTRVFSNGISIRAGINYSQINEKFTYSEGNIVQVVYIINANGDTIGSYTTTGSRYKTTYNKFKTLDIPVVLGYELGNGNFHANINAGIIINAYSWQKGEVLDASLQPVNITTGKSNSPYQYKTNTGIGFISSVSLYYKLGEKLHLMAEPYFRHSLTPASKEIITFKQKYNTAGLRLGVRLDLR